MKSYSDKLRHPKWQRMRLRVLEYAEWRCQICGDKETELHCHHSYYTRGKNPWEYPQGSIIAICKNCHGRIHGQGKPKQQGGQAITGDEAARRFAEMKAMLEQIQ